MGQRSKGFLGFPQARFNPTHAFPGTHATRGVQAMKNPGAIGRRPPCAGRLRASDRYLRVPEREVLRAEACHVRRWVLQPAAPTPAPLRGQQGAEARNESPLLVRKPAEHRLEV